jgi:hypothetical protein
MIFSFPASLLLHHTGPHIPLRLAVFVGSRCFETTKSGATRARFKLCPCLCAQLAGMRSSHLLSEPGHDTFHATMKHHHNHHHHRHDSNSSEPSLRNHSNFHIHIVTVSSLAGAMVISLTVFVFGVHSLSFLFSFLYTTLEDAALYHDIPFGLPCTAGHMQG